MSGKRGMNKYPVALKEKAVIMHIEYGLTIKEINNQLGIADEQRLKKWCAIYRRDGFMGLQPQPKGRPKKTIMSETELTANEIKHLRMENELLRSFLYEVGRR